MKLSAQNKPPPDAAQRRAAAPVVCYSVDGLPAYDRQFYESARHGLTKIGETIATEWLASAGADGKALLDAYRK